MKGIFNRTSPVAAPMISETLLLFKKEVQNHTETHKKFIFE